MRKLRILLICTVIMCSYTTTSAAGILTFNDVLLPQRTDGVIDSFDNPIYDPNYDYPSYYGGHVPGFSDGILNSGGFSFSGDHFHLINKPYQWPYGGFPYNGSYYIGTEGGVGRSSSITMTSIEGRPFSLVAFDGAEAYVNVAAAAADPTHHYAVATRILLSTWIVISG